ncbi:hypothetical protein [Paenibacillus sp. RC67]|uniref:hypothetical protein n=1 Tax=Paenibacillus sp. RC67 TaxID=3039392 RepID=UPI0024ACE9AE|nr:hypothetical protein [Paenibacillus sp. RC67]
MIVTLELAAYPQKSVLVHMVSLFLHDLSEFNEYECFNPDTGKFEFHNIDHFLGEGTPEAIFY